MRRKIKNLSNIFKPYKNPFLSLEKRLISPDERADKYFKYLEEVKKYNLLQAYLHPFKTIYAGIGIQKTNGLKTNIVHFINNFTASKEVNNQALDTLKEKLLEIHTNKIESIEYSDRLRCSINFKNGKELKFKTITSSIQFPPEFQTLEESLSTSDRQGKCHLRSIDFSMILPTNHNVEVVTGSTYNYSYHAKYLHSWVELDADDEFHTRLCLDNNWNAILRKEDYYFLQNPKIVETIPQERIEKDIDKILYLNKKSTKQTPFIKLYLTSPDEAINEYYKLKAKEESSLHQ